MKKKKNLNTTSKDYTRSKFSLNFSQDKSIDLHNRMSIKKQIKNANILTSLGGGYNNSTPALTTLNNTKLGSKSSKMELMCQDSKDEPGMT
jgi:hypothetical protein